MVRLSSLSESIKEVVNVIPAIVTDIRINLIHFESMFLLISPYNTKRYIINVGIEYMILNIK